jgi:hypothetical protein
LEPSCHPAGLGAKTPNGCLSLPQVIKETTQLRVETLQFSLTILSQPSMCLSVCLSVQNGSSCKWVPLYTSTFCLVSVSLQKTLIFFSHR